MPLPSCFPILNLSNFTNLVVSINAAQTEAELQALVNETFAELSVLESTITSQITLLGPLLAVLTAPAGNFTAIISWITNMIAVLQQMYDPIIALPAQITALTSAIATLTTAINTAASLKGFTITIPSVSVICEL